jgi:5-epi-alpha-selinene synthase
MTIEEMNMSYTLMVVAETLCQNTNKERPLDHFVIPDIYCPFPSLISPHLEQVQTHAQEWLNAIGLVPQGMAPSPFLTSDVPWMVCSIYPNAGLQELFLCCDWYNWGFTYDDLCDNSGLGRRPHELDQIYAHLLAVFQSSPPAPVRELMAAALSDIWQRARQLTSATWQQRFARHHADYLAGQRQEAVNRLSQQIPNVQAYIKNRRPASASTAVLDLIELVQHIEIPAEVYESQPFQTMLNSVYDIIAWTNDIYSLPKELAYGEVNNLVVVVQHEEGCSLQDAINRVCDMINRETQHFQALVQSRPSYPAEVDRIIRTYLIDVGHYIRTALDYERIGSRYQGQFEPTQLSEEI